MTEDQLDLLRKAGDSLAAARVLLDHGFSGYAAARAYYAMFYVAEAFLEGEGASFSKHSAVIAAFGRLFARSGKVPLEFHHFLIEGQELRHSGDYGELHSITSEQATEQISRAAQFLEVAGRLIGPIQPST